jgi:hypothetical protein
MASDPTTTAPTPPDTALAKPAAVERVPVHMGIAPTTIEEGWRLAQAFANSDLVPKEFRKHPEDVLVAMQMGIEIGFAPMQALQSIAVINGRPGVWGDGLLALVMGSSLYTDHDEYFEVGGTRREGLDAADLDRDTTVAVCTFHRRGKPLPVTRTFSIAQAKKAGLWGKAGPWQTYPDRMLRMRARSFAARDAFPDLLRGIRTAEELHDLPPEARATVDAPVVHRISDTPPRVARESLDGGDRGMSVAPAAAARGPEPERTTLEPARVVSIEPFLDTDVVTLGTGIRAIVTRAADTTELAKFVGTDHRVRLVVTRGAADELILDSFAIAD